MPVLNEAGAVIANEFGAAKGAASRPTARVSLLLTPGSDTFAVALGQVDVDIRYGISEWPHLVVGPIFEVHILPLASPDLLARLAVAPAELPVGAITSLAGAPFFLWLLHQRRELR